MFWIGQKYFAPVENRTQSRLVRRLVTVPTEQHETVRTDTLMSELTDSLVWWICQCMKFENCTGGCEQCWASCSSGTDCTVNSMMAQEMRWVRHVPRMAENRYGCRFSIEKPEGRRPLGRPRHRS